MKNSLAQVDVPVLVLVWLAWPEQHARINWGKHPPVYPSLSRKFPVSNPPLPHPIVVVMSPFWGSFAEQFRGSGRNATMFVLLVIALTFGVALASFTHFFQYADEFFAILAIFIVIRICIACSRIRKQRDDQSHRSPLSRDELKKARSKLVRNKSNNFSQNRY